MGRCLLNGGMTTVVVDVLLTALAVARTSQSCETGADLAPTPVKKNNQKKPPVSTPEPK